MLQNRDKVNIANYSNLSGAASVVPNATPTTTNNTKKPPSNTNTLSTVYHPPANTTTNTSSNPTVINAGIGVPVIPVVPVLAPPSLGGGGGGGGGGDEKSADAIPVTGKILGGHAMEVFGLSGLALLAGAVGCYFLAKHYKKNEILFASVGAGVLGLATYGVTTVFVYPTEKKSGFLGISKKGGTNKMYKCAGLYGQGLMYQNSLPCANGYALK